MFAVRDEGSPSRRLAWRGKRAAMSFRHCIVWLDHHEARVIDFSVDERHLVEVHSNASHRQLHRKAAAVGSGKAPVDREFFGRIVEALGDAHEVLLAGPGSAKVELHNDLVSHHPKAAARVVAVETLDHPSDGELLAFARKYFKRVDALRGDS